MFVSVTGVVIVLAAARLNTVPLTTTFCVVRVVFARPLLVPLDTRLIACVPLTTPAEAVLAEPRPSTRLELFADPPARLENVPELVVNAEPVPVPNPAFRPSV